MSDASETADAHSISEKPGSRIKLSVSKVGSPASPAQKPESPVQTFRFLNVAHYRVCKRELRFLVQTKPCWYEWAPIASHITATSRTNSTFEKCNVCPLTKEWISEEGVARSLAYFSRWEGSWHLYAVIWGYAVWDYPAAIYSSTLLGNVLFLSVEPSPQGVVVRPGLARRSGLPAAF